MGTKKLCDFWPSHEFVYREELEELRVKWDLLEAGIFVNAVKEVGLFIVIRSENNIVYSSLQDLKKSALSNTVSTERTYRMKL